MIFIMETNNISLFYILRLCLWLFSIYLDKVIEMFALSCLPFCVVLFWFYFLLFRCEPNLIVSSQLDIIATLNLDKLDTCIQSFE
jgi:hypothetical protein